MKNILKNYYGFILGFLLVSSVALGAKYYGDGIFDTVGIGSTTNPHASNVLDVRSTTKSARPCPAMTEVQRDAIASPQSGNCVYNTTTNKLNYYEASSWEEVGSGGGGSGDVVGPASATDEAVARYDLTTGKLIQNSLFTITDAGIGAGLTQFNLENLRLDLNSITSTNSNGNIILTPNGTGKTQLTANKGLLLSDDDSSVGVTVKVPATLSGDWTLTLPDDDGTNGYVLQTNGSGVTSWVAQSGGFSDPLTTNGDIIARIGGVTTRLGIGSEGEVLTVTSGLPSWETGGGGSGDVVGPASATDEAVARYNLTTGKLIQDSLFTITDAGVGSGLTQFNVDNLRLDGNVLSTTNSNGDLTLTPNGTGSVVVSTDLDVDNINVNANTITTTNSNGSLILDANGTGTITTNAPLNINDKFQGNISVDSSTSGTAQTVVAPSNITLQLSNTGLFSVTGISSPTSGQFIHLMNITGNQLVLLNELGTSNEQFITGTGKDFVLNNNASVWVYYYNNKWNLVGNNNNASTPLIQGPTTYTPTFAGFGTVSNVQMEYTVLGPYVRVYGRFTTGTVAGSTASFTLPNGWTGRTQGNNMYIPGWQRNNSSATTRKTGLLEVANATNTINFTSNDYTTASSPSSSLLGNAVASNTEVMIIDVMVPVTQLTQNTTSSLASQSIVYKATANSAGFIAYPTTAGQYGDATSFALKGGKSYRIKAQATFASSGATTTTFVYLGVSTTSGNSGTGLTAGDTVMYSTKNTTTGTYDPVFIEVEVSPTSDTTYYIKQRADSSITNLQYGWSASVIEIPYSTTALQTNLTYAARLRNSTTQAVTDGNTVVFDTVVFDPYGIYNTGTGRITFPVSGVWVVKSSVQTATVAASLGNTFSLNIRDITNSISHIDNVDICENTGTRPYTATSQRIFRANAGDTVEVWFSETLPAVNLNPGSSRNFIDVYKIGD